MPRSEPDLPPFKEAFTQGTRFARQYGGPIEMSLRRIGEFLRLPSGRVVAGDPGLIEFTAPPPPFAREVPVGSFPVELALAHAAHDRTRVACARVRFAAGPAVRWESASFVGTGADESAYEVFSELGCFFDAATRTAIDAATMKTWAEAIERNRESGWTWHVSEVGDANVVMFSTGHGGGYYSSYWGLDERGHLVELVTDFGLLYESLHEELDLPLPLPHGELVHPWLAARGISVHGAPPGETALILRGPKGMSFYLSEKLVARERWTGDECRLEWKRNLPGLRLVIHVPAGTRPLVPL